MKLIKLTSLCRPIQYFRSWWDRPVTQCALLSARILLFPFLLIGIQQTYCGLKKTILRVIGNLFQHISTTLFFLYSPESQTKLIFLYIAKKYLQCFVEDCYHGQISMNYWKWLCCLMLIWKDFRWLNTVEVVRQMLVLPTNIYNSSLSKFPGHHCSYPRKFSSNFSR